MTPGNPLLDAGNLYEAALFVTAVAGVIALFVNWLRRVRLDDLKTIAKERESDATNHAAVHSLIDHRFLQIDHKVSDLVLRTEALDRRDTDKDVRLARLELSIEGLRDGQDRIEQMQKELFADMERRFDMLAVSIREIREVRPK